MATATSAMSPKKAGFNRKTDLNGHDYKYDKAVETDVCIWRQEEYNVEIIRW